MDGLIAQLRRNQIALLSIIIACSSFAYGAWRNEATEGNRNLRAAGFETIREIANLERVVFFAHYDKDPAMGNPRQGLAHVLMLSDLGQLQTEQVQQRVAKLKEVWEANWSALGERAEAVKAISEAIDEVRVATKASLSALD